MNEPRCGWSPDGIYHAVPESVSAGMRWAVHCASAKAACGARCLPQPATWPPPPSESRQCPRCAEILARNSADRVARGGHATPDAGPTEHHAALGQQMEEFLVHVWACERDWALDDRIDGSIRYGR